MDDKQIAEILRRAEQMTKGTDANLRPTAFKAVFDMLVGQIAVPQIVQQPYVVTQGTQKIPSSSVTTDGDAFAHLLASINRTQHPDVFNEKRVLERALRVLKIAQGTHCEYLNTQQIAQVLTQKFRLSTTYQAVRFALESAPTFTDSKQNGRSTLYAIMHPGEQFLALPEAERATAHLKRPAVKSARKPGAKAEQKDPVEREAKPKRGNGSGPKGMVEQLVAEGFFASPKAVGEIRGHLKDTKGHTFSTSELAPALVRLLRDEVLKRTSNSENQYVYTANKS